MTTGGTLTFNDGEFVDVSSQRRVTRCRYGLQYHDGKHHRRSVCPAANDQVEIVVYDTFSVFGGNVDGDFNLNNGTMTITAAVQHYRHLVNLKHQLTADVLYLGPRA